MKNYALKHAPSPNPAYQKWSQGCINDNNMVHSMVTTGHSGNVPLPSHHTSNNKNKPFTAINTKGRTWWANKV